MNTQQYRTAPTWRTLGAGGGVAGKHAVQIDRANLILRNLVAMQADIEAIGHGFVSDRRTLELMVELANVAGRRPIRGRFGHPGISENATGKQVMVSGNFRIVTDERGTFLVHDGQLLKAARKSPVFGQDPIEYILTIAQSAPAEFAESVVIDAYGVWTRIGPDGALLDVPLYTRGEDGRLAETERPADALTALPVLRPTAFYYCDFVNEGALTHQGMFSMDASAVFDGHSAAYARELFDLVDRWRAAYRIPLDELPAKVDVILEKYMGSRKETTSMAKALGAQMGAGFDEDFGDENELDLNPPKSSSEVKADSALEKSGQSLRQAEQLAANLSAGEAEISNRSRLVTADELAILQATVDSQGERIQELSGQLRKATELLARSMNSLAALQRNMLRLDGEPVVAVPVAMTGGNPLESLQFGHPQPYGVPAMPRPSTARLSSPNVSSGGGQTAEQKAIEAQQRRAKAARG